MWKILLGALFDVLRGKDSTGEWADPKCSSCSGTGYVRTGVSGSIRDAHYIYDRCGCVNQSVQAAINQANQQQPVPIAQVYQQRDWRDTAAARALADSDAHFDALREEERRQSS